VFALARLEVGVEKNEMEGERAIRLASFENQKIFKFSLSTISIADHKTVSRVTLWITPNPQGR